MSSLAMLTLQLFRPSVLAALLND